MNDNTKSNAELAELREKFGRREKDRSEHYALCNGILCPCYREGRFQSGMTDDKPIHTLKKA